MYLEEFLHLGGTDTDAVIANVDESLGLQAEDVLLAVGSLAEGMGSRKSDVDLVLITPRTESLADQQDHVASVVGDCLVDTLVLPAANFEGLLDRFDAWASEPWNVMHAAKFSIEERTLLHRLIHAKVLPHGKRAGGAEDLRRPASLDLARLKLHVARQKARTILVDMIGYRDNGDYRSLVFASQEVLGHAVDALLAGYRMTNSLMKWRSRMLESVPADWESSLAARPSGLLAGERVWQLRRAPQRPDEEPSVDHALQITTFARAVFAWAEIRLVVTPEQNARPLSWARVERDHGEAPLPYLDFDVDFFLADGVAALARLNEFGEPVTMLPQELGLALLFDATTTPREAALAVFGPDVADEGESAVDRLLSGVKEQGLEFAFGGLGSAADG